MTVHHHAIQLLLLLDTGYIVAVQLLIKRKEGILFITAAELLTKNPPAANKNIRKL